MGISLVLQIVHAAVFSQYLVRWLFMDYRAIYSLGVVFQALLLSSAKELLRALLSRHCRRPTRDLGKLEREAEKKSKQDSVRCGRQ